MVTAFNHPLHPCFKLPNLFLFLCCCIFTAWPALSHSAATINRLPGFSHGSPLPFHLETGYIEVDELNGVEFFYYFIESERSPGEDPLLLWLTGGPGCSAFSSLSLEIGPLKFESVRYDGSLPTLVYNPYSWTKLYNIIFLDSPVGTGFSFSRHPQGYENGDESWTKHAEIFLRKWFRDHKQFLSNPLYIAGDSYAGKVVPVIIHRLLNGDHEFGEQPILNFKGYFIGNPTTGEFIDYNAKVPFTFGMGIISDDFYQIISELMNSNILEPLCGLATPWHKFPVGARSVLQETPSILSSHQAPELNCRGTVEEWLRCNYGLNYTYGIRSSIPYHVNLITRGYPALVYSGDHDLMLPIVGTKEWIRSLNFTITSKWRSWHVDNQVAGYTESYSKNLTFASVKGAGHTAPEYKPKECRAMIQRWISGKPL